MSLSELIKKIKDQLNRFKNEFSKIRTKGSFAQNVSIVFSGNVLNFLLQLLFTPILSRIYDPDAYGQYAYYNLIVTNVGFLAALSFPSIYVIPRTKIEYLALGKLVIFNVLGLSLASTVLFFFLNGTLIQFEGSLASIPLMIVLITLNALNGILVSWNIREKRFKKNTKAAVKANMLSKLGTTGIGYFGLSTGLGLLIGDLIKIVFLFAAQTSTKIKLVVYRFLRLRNWGRVKQAFKESRNVPKFFFPSQLMSKWITDVPLIVIGGYYSLELLGFYTFAVSIISLPSRLFENSISPVMFQKANEVFRENEQALGGFLLKSLKVTFGISFLPVISLAFSAPYIFPVLFGNQWTYAGEITLLLCIKYLMQGIAMPYASFWRIIRQEKRLLFVKVISIAFNFAPLLLILLDVDFETFLQVYAISSSVGTMVIFGELLSQLFEIKKALKTITLILLITYISYALTLWLSHFL